MSDHSELKQLAETLLACDRYTDFGRWAAALDAFEDASGPDVVLALIGEIDGLRSAEGDAMTYKAGMENVAHQRDQLKAEVESLRSSKLYWVCPPGLGIIRCVPDERYRKLSSSIRGRYEPVRVVEAISKGGAQ